MADSFWAKHWERKRARAQEARVSKTILVRRVARRLQVIVPYDDRFPPRARELNGRWRERSSMWSFPLQSKRLVLDLIKEVFGPQPESPVIITEEVVKGGPETP